MVYLRFLDFPVSIRDQIYAELLVPHIIKVDEFNVTQSLLFTDILYTNKQIYTESSDVLYTRNLLIVISTNSKTLLAEQTRNKTPIFSVPKNPSTVTQCHRFAMTIELIGIDDEATENGTPAFVISAKALPCFATSLIGKYTFRSGVGYGIAAVRMKVENTFRYSTARFSNLTFGRLLSAEHLPKFNCLRIEGQILEEHHHAMARDYLNESEHSCGFFGLGLDAYRHRVWFRMRNEDREAHNQGIKLETPDSQIHRLPRLLLRFFDIFWDCHNYRVHELGHNCSMDACYQFARMADMYNTLVQGYVLAAKRHPERATNSYTQALHAAEEGIMYLNRDDRFVRSKADTTEAAILKVNSAKTLLSLKAAKACSKLGDEKAARKYIEDAAIYSPIMFPAVMDRLAKLFWKTWPAEPLVTTTPILWNK
ncbi:hypothetical protein K505DRAFT_359699 [Melanomma pulvis-pyrius CBS 109.77]|uniref:Uncharacterized protein n=1 Tax=Melanomma pulvis-pyrius CBS 109.77 TaxID=1314802 RepID=A0A6A6XIH4_9PLEO|nr:hypothetical protein K505DRAFT_359699 [Melanomma pulvis-pyrius CBS 109.77]